MEKLKCIVRSILPNQKSCIFVAVLMAAAVPPTYRNTKRYARLANGNVRNFYNMQEWYNGSRCFSVDCLLHLHIRVSHNLH